MDLNKNKGNIYVTKYSATSIIRLKKRFKSEWLRSEQRLSS